MCPLDITGYRDLNVMSASESPDQDKLSGHEHRHHEILGNSPRIAFAISLLAFS